jgi:hypothetical protein
MLPFIAPVELVEEPDIYALEEKIHPDVIDNVHVT